jgi:hypothetical protein
MTERRKSPKPTSINLPAPDGVQVEQTGTRGDASIELGEVFEASAIDYSRVMSHLAIHTSGEVAGSQFNGDVFATPVAIVECVQATLPETLNYDQHGRAELTITVNGSTVGYSGVKPLAELRSVGGVQVERGMRTPGGERAEFDGIQGAWFPEMTRNPETGRFEVALDENNEVKNPHGKFEPEAWIASVDEATLSRILATDKLTVILQKNPENELPTALTIFPGENAPAFPAKIQSNSFQLDTLKGGSEAAYWSEHAFIQISS